MGHETRERTFTRPDYVSAGTADPARARDAGDDGTGPAAAAPDAGDDDDDEADDV